ncbi:hypothetical protein LCGC14_2105650 [marine sediment metagenome]|uniref:Uncharacterized protein n=1 Tax=marine sediment metagenome TaxID=412755 RepID=A0A0F9EVX4_9ZZZZ
MCFHGNEVGRAAVYLLRNSEPDRNGQNEQLSGEEIWGVTFPGRFLQIAVGEYL